MGLQEVSLLRSQFPGDYLSGNPIVVEHVIYDYYCILLDEMKARGQHDRVASI